MTSNPRSLEVLHVWHRLLSRAKRLLMASTIAQVIAHMLVRLMVCDIHYLRKTLISTPVIFGPKERVYLGRGVDLQNALLNTASGSISIGDFTFCGHNCMILTGTHDYLLTGEARQHDHPRVGGDISIGQGVWIGSGAIILSGVSIADNAVIAAGSVVTRDCPQAAIYSGVPAREMKEIGAQLS